MNFEWFVCESSILIVQKFNTQGMRIEELGVNR